MLPEEMNGHRYPSKGNLAFIFPRVLTTPSWWRHYRETLLHYWLSVGGIHRSPMDSHHKGPVMRSFYVSLLLARTILLNKNSWAAGNMWRYDTPVTSLHIDGLVQDCSNSVALAMELLQSYTEPSIWSVVLRILPILTMSLALSYLTKCFLNPDIPRVDFAGDWKRPLE